MADAEAIAETASRPTMRFVEVKSEESQVRAMLFRTRQMLVRQPTRTINALRSHLAERGVIAPKSRAGVARLTAAMDDDDLQVPDNHSRRFCRRPARPAEKRCETNSNRRSASVRRSPAPSGSRGRTPLAARPGPSRRR